MIPFPVLVSEYAAAFWTRWRVFKDVPVDPDNKDNTKSAYYKGADTFFRIFLWEDILSKWKNAVLEISFKSES